MKTRTRRARQLRSLGGQRLFTQYSFNRPQVEVGGMEDLVLYGKMLGIFFTGRFDPVLLTLMLINESSYLKDQLYV